jgi:hypothetical protein
VVGSYSKSVQPRLAPAAALTSPRSLASPAPVSDAGRHDDDPDDERDQDDEEDAMAEGPDGDAGMSQDFDFGS